NLRRTADRPTSAGRPPRTPHAPTPTALSAAEAERAAVPVRPHPRQAAAAAPPPGSDHRGAPSDRLRCCVWAWPCWRSGAAGAGDAAAAACRGDARSGRNKDVGTALTCSQASKGGEPMSDDKNEATGELDDEQLSNVSGGVAVGGAGAIEPAAIGSPRDPA